MAHRTYKPPYQEISFSTVRNLWNELRKKALTRIRLLDNISRPPRFSEVILRTEFELWDSATTNTCSADLTFHPSAERILQGALQSFSAGGQAGDVTGYLDACSPE